MTHVTCPPSLHLVYILSPSIITVMSPLVHLQLIGLAIAENENKIKAVTMIMFDNFIL